MSLKGPMRGNKEYVVKLLEPYKIWVQAVKFSSENKEEGIATYRIIYDVPRGKEDTPFHETTKAGEIADLLIEHFDDWDIEVQTTRTIRPITVGGWFRYRVEATLYFYKKEDSD